ncbi:pyridoxamine 5'-phosphate oxidase family protein [Amycolatopsis sp.]|jgi:PPOX class probable F420-dependent enzyme|uniref:pyridoxamine 5'-phosphate oxidase family protein n=1 Tax=Amycolatopsis sp. TaxID=37632 RepID=UPI002DFEF255|nr:pyridoxamine 5'-phosphate oxidase family protein [Amycolatopsis sp.]
MAFEPDEKLLKRVDEPLAWLTTVTPTNRPAPRPIWFVYVDGAFIVFSQTGAAKLKHITANPNVSINFNTNTGGGDVLVVSGTAEIVEGIKASTTPGYLDKYEALYAGIGSDVAKFDAEYNVGIRVTPTKSWGF